MIKLSKEDLWTKDLDDFIAEWRFQLEDEDKRQKKVASLGRRASSKLKISAKGPIARKRKAQGDDPDDSDFGLSKSKRPAVVNRVQPKTGLLSHLSKPSTINKPSVKAEVTNVKPVKTQSEDVWMQIDGAVDTSPAIEEKTIAPVFKKARAAAAAKQATTKIDEDLTDDDEDMIKPVTTRQPRAAARKAIHYGGSDDSDDDNGDDLLGDVSKMVKGIGGGPAHPTPGGRSLFSTSMSRPGSSAGLPRSSSKPSKLNAGLSDDETDYSKLAPQPPVRKSAAVTTKVIQLSDEEGDSFTEIMTKPAPKATKPPAAPKQPLKPTTTKAPAASKAKKAPAKKVAPAPAVPAPPKKTLLSPAAKAYEAKQARCNKKRVIDSDDEEDAEDEVEDIANDILDSSPAKDKVADSSDPSPPRAAAAGGRPTRRAVVAAKKPAYVVDDDDDDSEEDGSEGDGFSEDFEGSD